MQNTVPRSYTIASDSFLLVGRAIRSQKRLRANHGPAAALLRRLFRFLGEEEEDAVEEEDVDELEASISSFFSTSCTRRWGTIPPLKQSRHIVSTSASGGKSSPQVSKCR